jgi:hypothetical protein
MRRAVADCLVSPFENRAPPRTGSQRTHHLNPCSAARLCVHPRSGSARRRNDHELVRSQAACPGQSIFWPAPRQRVALPPRRRCLGQYRAGICAAMGVASVAFPMPADDAGREQLVAISSVQGHARGRRRDPLRAHWRLRRQSGPFVRARATGDAIRPAICLGGDTDSTAAIVEALTAGAHCRADLEPALPAFPGHEALRRLGTHPLMSFCERLPRCREVLGHPSRWCDVAVPLPEGRLSCRAGPREQANQVGAQGASLKWVRSPSSRTGRTDSQLRPRYIAERVTPT